MPVSWLLKIGDERLELHAVEVRASLNRPPEVCLWIAKGYPDLQPGAFAEILSVHGSLLKLVIRSFGEDESLQEGMRRWIVGGFEEPPADGIGADSVRIVQKQLGESLAAFINRCGLSGKIAEANGLDGEAADFASAFPVGSCALVGAGEDAECRQQRLFGWLQQYNPSIVGRSRGLHKEREFEYRISTFNPEAKDSNFFMAAGPEWRLGPGVAETTRLVRRLWAANPQEVFAHLQDPGKREITVERMGNPTESFPTLPMTVRVGKQDYFASGVRFQIYPEVVKTDGKPEYNVEVSLDLSESPRCLTRRSNASAGSHLLLGMFQGWRDGDDRTRMLNILPASYDDVSDIELVPLTRWSVQPGSENPQPLVAAQLIPGFARAEHSSFYARLAPGDLVFVSVRFGGVPLLLGSPQQKRTAFEEPGGAEVAINASQVRVAALNDDGSTAETDLTLWNNGNIAIRAKEALTVLENLEVRADMLRVASAAALAAALHVKGDTGLAAALTVGGDATMAKNVVVSKKLEVGGAAIGPSEVRPGLPPSMTSIQLGPTATKLAAQLGDSASKISREAMKKIEQQLAALESSIQQKFEQAVAPLTKIAAAAAGEVEGRLNSLQNSVVSAVENEAAKLEEKASKLTEQISSQLETVATQAEEQLTKARNQIEQAAEELKRSISQPLEEIQQKIEDQGEKVRAEFRAAADRVSKLEQEIADGVSSAEERLEQEWNALQATGDAAVRKYAGEARQKYEELRKGAQEKIEAAEGQVTNAQNWIKQQTDKAEAELAAKASELREEKQNFESVVRNEVGAAEKKVRITCNQVKNAVDNAVSQVKGAADSAEQAVARVTASVVKLTSAAEVAGFKGKCKVCMENWRKAGKLAELELRNDGDRLVADLKNAHAVAEESYKKILRDVCTAYERSEEDLRQRVEDLVGKIRKSGGWQERLEEKLAAVKQRADKETDKWKIDADAFATSCRDDVEDALKEARSIRDESQNAISQQARLASQKMEQALKDALDKVREQAKSLQSGDGRMRLLQRAHSNKLRTDLVRAEALLDAKLRRMRLATRIEADPISAFARKSIRDFHNSIARTEALAESFLAQTESASKPVTIKFTKDESGIEEALSSCEQARNESMRAAANVRNDSAKSLENSTQTLWNKVLRKSSQVEKLLLGPLSSVEALDTRITAEKGVLATLEGQLSNRVAELSTKIAETRASGRFTPAMAKAMEPVLKGVETASQKLKIQRIEIEVREMELDQAKEEFNQESDQALTASAGDAESLLAESEQSAAAVQARADVAFEQAADSMEKAAKDTGPHNVEIDALAERENECKELADKALAKIRAIGSR
jgi:ElaB/YqjD/DUF883 family membrane-anchored ribosome-binding protein